ncbi:hypothetical protein [Bacillus thermotolerans]|uniref:Uncharacterized protein n=1 Tax=Bacillus thermotolerans TaxID=1221996 RepID=A0A0F5HM83_BACTR|nr:hypothetical protein [Bacillus thermotolerans]KKB34277.1 hypothetical protein QY96_00244 [Bacillus thermotolerans]KKB34401.1 hypothetical protein QY97_02474 [Bacillus thermotolerans]KKB38358.1 hypothetical protein QY95_02606 [Bacillus thermotolerans]
MNLQREYVKKLIGLNSTVRRKEEGYTIEQFSNPLIHRQIHGNEVYVPLDLQKLWGK